MRAARPRILDDPVHQQSTKAPAFLIRAHRHREFSGFVVGIGDRAHHAQRPREPVFARHRRDQRHFAVVVDLRHARELRVIEAAHRAEKPQTQIFGRHRFDEVVMRGLVFRTDRPHRHPLALPVERLFEAARIRHDREAAARARRGSARVDHRHVIAVHPQRQRQADDLPDVADRLRERRQRGQRRLRRGHAARRASA